MEGNGGAETAVGGPAGRLSGGVLVAGCGYVGGRVAAGLAEEGVVVWGLKRDPTDLPPGVRPVAADVTDRESLAGGLPRVGALVYAVAPAGPMAGAYRAAYVTGLHNVLAAVPGGVERVVLVSSTGVYGQTDGRWVDEDTDPEPGDDMARVILEAEAVATAGAATGVVLRLGGIYGPGRTRTVRQVVSGETRCPPEGTYGNRIHADDAAAAVRHLLRLADPAPLYIGVDQEPAPLRDVYAWIARRAGVPDPCAGGRGAQADGSSASGAGRRGTNKRCSSRRISATGFVFRFPTYREGYGPMVDELAGRGPGRGG
jgi:nucleoside-diphosphate-sugar epimerase